MDRIDVRLSRITGQTQRPFEIVVAEDPDELGWFARLIRRFSRKRAAQ